MGDGDEEEGRGTRGRQRDEKEEVREEAGGKQTAASREGAKAEESRQTRRQTRSGRRSTRAAALERMLQRGSGTGGWMKERGRTVC